MAIQFKTAEVIFQELQARLTEQVGVLSDLNTGSVINQILYAVSNGQEDLENLLLDLYDASLTLRATGVDLDNKVADYGLVRRDATTASGTVTLFKTTLSSGSITIPAGTIVATPSTSQAAGSSYILDTDIILPQSITGEAHQFFNGQSKYNFDTRLVGQIVQIVGTKSGTGYTFVLNSDYILNTTDDTSQAKIEWLNTGNSPDANTTFYVDYKPLSVDVTITASIPGSVGNTPPETITVINNPPNGISGVINYTEVQGGVDVETDIELKSRVPLYLSSLSKGTRKAIISRVLSVPGIKNVTLDEPNPPIGFINCFIDDGTGGASRTLLQQAKNAVDGLQLFDSTEASIRAAGVAVNVFAPTIHFVNINLTVRPVYGTNTQTATTDIQTAISNYLSTLTAGQSVLRAGIASAVYILPEIDNVDLVTLYLDGQNTEDLSIDSTTIARMGTVTLFYLPALIKV